MHTFYKISLTVSTFFYTLSHVYALEDTPSINITPLATWYKIVVIGLCLCNIWLYKAKDIGEAIIGDFKHCVYIWLSLGMLIAAIFIFGADEAGTLYVTMFSCIAFFLSLSYLCTQYSQAKNKKLSLVCQIKLLLLAFIDLSSLVFMTKSLAFLLILLQTLITISLYHPQKRAVID